MCALQWDIVQRSADPEFDWFVLSSSSCSSCSYSSSSCQLPAPVFADISIEFNKLEANSNNNLMMRRASLPAPVAGESRRQPKRLTNMQNEQQTLKRLTKRPKTENPKRPKEKESPKRPKKKLKRPKANRKTKDRPRSASSNYPDNQMSKTLPSVGPVVCTCVLGWGGR